jgi:hypothetical protein
MKLNKRQIKKRYPEITKQLADLEKRMINANKLHAKLLDLGIPGLWNPSHGLTSCTMGCTLNNLTGFKDERLTDILEKILSLDPTECSTSDYPNSLNRDYRFFFPGSIIVTVFAYVLDNSPTCRRVVVGERYVESRTEYEFALECD